MTDTRQESPPPTTPPTLAAVPNYLAAAGDARGVGDRVTDDLIHLAPGRNRLAGVRRGPGAVASWFTEMNALSTGSYRIAETVDRLASDTAALLLTREHARVAGIERDWTRAVLLDVRGDRISRVQLFEDDQYGYDEWLGAAAGTGKATATSDPATGLKSAGAVDDEAAQAPQMTGDLDDPRVRAVLVYQRQVAAGDLASARTIFWPDVTYTVPGRSTLAGTYRGPEEVMGYLGTLFALTDGSYAISHMHWLTSLDRVALVARNHATRGGVRLAWDELIVFAFVDGRKKSISHFSGDQYGVDALFG